VSRVMEIAPGLRRWTALHDEWREEVASLAVDTRDGLVLIDPIDPPRGVARPDHVLLTVFWHGRSAGDFSASHVWASKRAVRRLGNRGVTVTDTIEETISFPEASAPFQPPVTPSSSSGYRSRRPSSSATFCWAPVRSRMPPTSRCDSARSAGSATHRMLICSARSVRCSTCRCSVCSYRTANLCCAGEGASSPLFSLDTAGTV
jgi:hypothetical protein